MTSKHDLEAAIVALEAQRKELGDSVVDIAIKPLQLRLDALPTKDTATENKRRLKQVTVLFTDIVGSTVMAWIIRPARFCAARWIQPALHCRGPGTCSRKTRGPIWRWSPLQVSLI